MGLDEQPSLAGRIGDGQGQVCTRPPGLDVVGSSKGWDEREGISPGRERRDVQRRGSILRLPPHPAELSLAVSEDDPQHPVWSGDPESEA